MKLVISESRLAEEGIDAQILVEDDPKTGREVTIKCILTSHPAMDMLTEEFIMYLRKHLQPAAIDTIIDTVYDVYAEEYCKERLFKKENFSC